MAGEPTAAEHALSRLSGRVRTVELARQPAPGGGINIHVLVEPGGWQAALAALADESWRYRLGQDGVWRLAPVVSYLWPDGSQLFVNRHIAAGPLPSRWYRKLSAVLWETARDGVADPVPAAVHLAVQGLRAGSYHEQERDAFAAYVAADPAARDAVRGVAAQVGLGTAVDVALAGADRGRWSGAPAPDGRAPAARVLLGLHRRLRPAWLRQLLTGTPQMGAAPLRARLSGVETAVPPAVFAPTPDIETLIDMVVAEMPLGATDIVVDCGSGVGAIALGVAHQRPTARVFALELSRPAVRAAVGNARRARLANVTVLRGSLLEPLPSSVDGQVRVLVANLPFYPAARFASIGDVARNTIQGADDDGLGLYRQLLQQAERAMAADSVLVLQMFADQWPQLAPELARLGFVAEGARTVGPFILGRAVRRTAR